MFLTVSGVIGLATASSAQQTYTFTGAVDDQWDNASNWDPPMIPFGDPNATVILPSGKSVYHGYFEPNTIHSLQMGEGSSIAKYGNSLEVTGPSLLTGSISNQGSFLSLTHPQNQLRGNLTTNAYFGLLSIASESTGTMGNLNITGSEGYTMIDVPSTTTANLNCNVYEGESTVTTSDVLGNLIVSGTSFSGSHTCAIATGDVSGNVIASATDSIHVSIHCKDIGGDLGIISSGYGCQPCGSSGASVLAHHVQGKASASSAESGVSYMNVKSCAELVNSDSFCTISEASHLNKYTVACSSYYSASNTMSGPGIVTVGECSVYAGDYTWGSTTSSATAEYIHVLDKLAVGASTYPGSPYSASAILSTKEIQLGPQAEIIITESVGISAGSFSTEQTNEFLWSFHGRLSAGSAFSTGSLEVAGTDYGVDGYYVQNFNIPKLLVKGTLRLVDNIDNGNRTFGTPETVYFPGISGQDGLQISDGATLELGTFNAYAFLNGTWTNLRDLVPAGNNCVQFGSGNICIDQVCYPDCDGNGVLSILDFSCFTNAYSSGDPYADCDGNSLFNVFDYICFGNAFAAGCP
ncbi:MAG: hypothetical protein R3B58_13535 [Phycisphaerales bacterium]|nr:hypothetical protein [Phycisphaerales bacterium]